MKRAMIFCGLLAIFLPNQAAFSKTMSASKPGFEIVAALVESVPKRLSELENIVGSLARDPKLNMMELTRNIDSAAIGTVSAHLAIDIYHQDPRKVEDPDLSRFSVAFKSGYSDAMALLGKKYGQAKSFEKDGKTGYRFDTTASFYLLGNSGFYIFPGEGGAFVLEWRDTVPDFAIAQRTEQETQDIESKLLNLLASGLSGSRFQEVLGAYSVDKFRNENVIRRDTWMFEARPSGSTAPEYFIFTFAPPLDGKKIIEALGIKQAVVVSTTVHQTNRVLADFKNRTYPKVGKYGITIDVEDANLESTDLRWGASPVWQAKNYRIQSIEGRLENAGR